MLVFQSSNPCLCTPTSPPSPDCPEDCTCLKVCNITLNANDPSAVGPCAAIGTLDISSTSYGHDFCACGVNPVYWSIAGYDNDIFVAAEITSAGVLTWITQGEEVAGKYGTVIVKVCCGELSAYMVVLIGVADLCNCPSCGPCGNCDPCTGICLEDDVDVSISGIDNSANVSITSS